MTVFNNNSTSYNLQPNLILNLHMDDTKSELNDINNVNFLILFQENSNYSQDDEELLEECMGKINLDKPHHSITDTDFKPRFSLSLIPSNRD